MRGLQEADRAANWNRLADAPENDRVPMAFRIKAEDQEPRRTGKTGRVYPLSVNVLSEEKKQQATALGRLGWSLRQIQRATRIRRETAAGYLKAAGIPVRASGGWGRRPNLVTKVSADPETRSPLLAADPPPAPRPSDTREAG